MLVLGRSAQAESLTFHLTVSDALASVARYNAFVASLGKRARRVKVVPGGTTFARETCAAFGDVYRLGAIRVLDGPGAIQELMPPRRRRNATALENVFRAAGVHEWAPPATEATTDLPFWTAGNEPHAVRFVADGVTLESEAGLVGAESGARVLRFRADVAGTPSADGRYRFLVELYGRTSPNDGALVVRAERRCFTFVDLAPVDLSVLVRLVDEMEISSPLRSTLQSKLVLIAANLAQGGPPAAFANLAAFTTSVISGLPDKLQPVVARRLVAAAFQVRRGLLLSAGTSVCGNGIREIGEACDGGDLGGFGCASLGYHGGTLACQSTCQFDTSGCAGTPECGDGKMDLGEECDDGKANSDTRPDACRMNCKLPFCGDGVLDISEECENVDTGGETCESEGYDAGTLRCLTDECLLDFDSCFLLGDP
jgi:hypothetical protein